ncbi:MAG: hypothetical protein FWD59_08415, partial [Micrococcales bacterium]|nr:hypothetical protein [Micrococcales bacterium]
LLKGGYTLTGRIAGHKKADKVTVLACTDMMVTYLDVQDFSPANRGYCYRGFVARDGSYMVPGMASAVAAVTVSSARASRIAVVDMLAKAKNRVATQNFAALARTMAPAINVPTVSVSGYFAPGFTLTAGVTAPLPSGPPVTMSYVWTDGGTILDRGPTLAVTQAMMGAIVHPIVIASIADRDIAAFVPGRNNLAGEEASVDTIPFPGRIHGADGPLALVPSEKKQPWGRSYAAEDPPTGWTYDYQWMCNNSQIPGAITGAYDTVLANIGCTLTVVIDAHGPSGQGGTRRIVNPAIIVDSRDIDPAMMAVQGPGTIGATLQLVNPPAATFAPSYQWLRDTLPINGATGTSYVLTPADKGSIVTVSVIAKASGYRTLDAVIGRVLVAPVKPTITAKVSSKAVATKQQAKLPITVQILDDPWNGEVGLAGTLKVKVGKKSVSKTLKAADLGSVTLTLPKLPKGKHKVSITFTPTDKAISKGTLNPKGKVVVR